MFGGGGGLNPRKMKQMMQQMGIELEELEADEVVIRMEGEELHFTDPDVTRMDARGQQTYQIVGEPESRDRSTEGGEAEESSEGIPDEDVEIVAARTGSTEDEARDALEAVDGDLAAAVQRLE